jgi:hypothetical protein
MDVRAELDGKGSDCNVGKDGGPNRVQRHGLKEWNWMTRVWTWRYKNNVDEDGGPNGVRRRGLEEWNWMTRVWTCRYKNNADEDGGPNGV